MLLQEIEDEIAEELVKKCPVKVFDIEDIGKGKMVLLPFKVFSIFFKWQIQLQNCYYRHLGRWIKNIRYVRKSVKLLSLDFSSTLM